MSPTTAHAAAEAIWAVMVEVAEAGNDLVVASQTSMSKSHACKIAALAETLAGLARSAALLADLAGPVQR